MKPKHVAWLLPVAYSIHIADECLLSNGFPSWFSETFDVNLSSKEFILINSIGFTATILIVFLYNLNKIKILPIAVLGSLFFINGIIHLAASVLTLTYSPGTISGIVIYLPLGFLVFKNIFPMLSEHHRFLAVGAGIIIQFVVAIVALTV